VGPHSRQRADKRPPRTAWMRFVRLPCSDAGGAWAGGFGLWGVVCGEQPQIRAKFSLPGPLTLAWAYKASSTLDSMLAIAAEVCSGAARPARSPDDLLHRVALRFVPRGLPLGQRPGLAGVDRWNVQYSEGRSDPPQCRPSQRAYAPGGQVASSEGSNHYREERSPQAAAWRSDSRRSIKPGLRGSCR